MANLVDETLGYDSGLIIYGGSGLVIELIKILIISYFLKYIG